MKDSSLISDLKSKAEPFGLKLLIAEHYVDSKHTISDKVENLIADSDFALFLLTKDGLKSKFMDQELGYIQSLKMPYIQIVQEGLEKKITGFNYGRDYIPLNQQNSQETIVRVTNILVKHWEEKKEIEKKQIDHKRRQILIQQQENIDTQIKIFLGIFVGFLLLCLLTNSNQ